MTSFLLNGQPRRIAPPPGRTVLDHLRLEARLTGTKEGCAEGDCGACTVAIGRPSGDGLKFSAVNACIMLASDLDGCALVTAEGVAEGDQLSALQQNLVSLHASQCGFCTPGFVTSLYAFTQSPKEEDPRRYQEDLLDALAGNLCRCTGYRPILDAAHATPHAPDPRAKNWAAALASLPLDDSAPRSLAELDAILAGSDQTITAGTTDLGVAIAKHGRIPPRPCSIRGIQDLRTIEAGAKFLSIGAASSFSEILPHLETHFPPFARLVRRIGSVQIRNAGTMGGNLCNASPIGDSAPCLIALGAVLILRSAAGERELPAEQFFTGYRKTALRPGEYLKTIQIPYLGSEQKLFAYKLAKRFDQDISTVAAAFRFTLRDGAIAQARIAFGGMAATPLRVPELEAALTGQPCTEAIFAAAGQKIPSLLQPISDFRGTAAYRLEAARAFLLRAKEEILAPGAATDIWSL